MRHFNNILCVVTPGTAGRPTLERAVTLAENNQARLTVIDVIPPAEAEARLPAAPSGTNARAAASGRLQALESFTAPYRRRLQIHCAVATGTLFLEIIRAVLRDGHDLLIKPAENPSFVNRMFGSNDMHLLRKCPCPVWLTRPGETSNYRSILAAVDFHPHELHAVEQDLNGQIIDLSTAIALSDFADLHLLHVWDAPGETTVRAWSDDPNAAAAYVAGERASHEKGLHRLRTGLRDLLGPEAFDYLSPQFHLRRGNASTLIPEIAKALNADMVVMGTVARIGIAGLFIGNTAEAVLEQLQCSVLAIKPRGFVSPVTLG